MIIGILRVPGHLQLITALVFSDQWHEPLLYVFYLFLALLFQVHHGHCSLYFDEFVQEKRMLMHWSYVFFALTHWFVLEVFVLSVLWSVACKLAIVRQNWDDIDPMPVCRCHHVYVLCDVNFIVIHLWLSARLWYHQCINSSALSHWDVIVFVLINCPVFSFLVLYRLLVCDVYVYHSMFVISVCILQSSNIDHWHEEVSCWCSCSGVYNVLCAQIIPSISSLSPITTIIPLGVVLSVSAIKDAIDDIVSAASAAPLSDGQPRVLGYLVVERDPTWGNTLVV